MKLVTFTTSDQTTHAGVIHDRSVIALPYPTLLALLHDPDGLAYAQSALDQQEASKNARDTVPLHTSSNDLSAKASQVYSTNEVVLLAPIPTPPTMRDFYAFEQHVKTARAQRSLDVLPEWYEIPTFYFTNTSEIYGHGTSVPYPVGSEALDFELEVACVIGRAGKDIPVEEAANHIVGYTIMNDWSARDFQRKDMKLGLGPGKGKDFATSLGPYLITPDELASHRSGQGASERYDLTMLARVNGREISRGNWKDIYYSFPQMIAWASRNVRLNVGDILGSGTVGTGCILELGTEVQRWLQRGDEIELEIEGIGVLGNSIV